MIRKPLLPPYGRALVRAIARNLITGTAATRIRTVCPVCDEDPRNCSCDVRRRCPFCGARRQSETAPCIRCEPKEGQA